MFQRTFLSATAHLYLSAEKDDYPFEWVVEKKIKNELKKREIDIEFNILATEGFEIEFDINLYRNEDLLLLDKSLRSREAKKSSMEKAAQEIILDIIHKIDCGHGFIVDFSNGVVYEEHGLRPIWMLEDTEEDYDSVGEEDYDYSEEEDYDYSEEEDYDYLEEENHSYLKRKYLGSLENSDYDYSEEYMYSRRLPGEGLSRAKIDDYLSRIVSGRGV